MNRPDKPGELSIDEILASIRQNASEEQEAPPSALGSASEAPPPPPEMRPSLQARLSGVSLGAPQATAAQGAAAKRPQLPFDQDLADLLDEPATAEPKEKPDMAESKAAPTQPEGRLTPDLGAPGGTQKPPVSGHADSPASGIPTPSAIPGATAAPAASPSPGKTTGAGAPSASTSATEPSLSAPSLSAPSPLAPAAPPASAAPSSHTSNKDSAAHRPQAFGFPPLTNRSGFYPAERPEPILPPVRSDGIAKAAPDPSPAPTEHATPPFSRTTNPATRFPDFGSLVPSDVVGRGVPAPDLSFGGAPTSFGAPPREGEGGSVNDPARVLPELGASPRPVGEPVPTAPTLSVPPAASASAGSQPAPSPTPQKAPPPGKPEAPSSAAPSVARPTETAPVAAPPGDKASPSVTVGSGKEAAAKALGALAEGLAASSSGSASPAAPQASPPAPHQPRPMVARRQDTPPKPEETVARPALGAARPDSSPAMSSAPAAAAASARTLEDVVADMLRPMLQQWVQENMPRIMEKALRSEMQRTLASGGGAKPPGS